MQVSIKDNGMPLFLYPNYIDKKPIAVNRL